jgi:predicted NAD-dependent protein-ADP-ribosyltransferase YbiA (DUF1768 family)
MDIKTGNGYPASALSNFAPHPFIFDGVKVVSMEGLLQAFKFKEPEMQAHVCSLVGKAAKMKGRNKRWQERQILHWQGAQYERDGSKYQKLLDRAYFEMCSQSDSFRRALLATQDAVLQHSIGKSKTNETVLTRTEFTSRLTKLRRVIQETWKPRDFAR